MRVLRAIAISLALWPIAAAAQPASETDFIERITSGLSQDDIPINATFTGRDILVFGAIERSRFFEFGMDTLPDVVIALKGPSRPYTVRKKEHVAGVWTNNAQVRVASAPAYYAIASTQPVEQLLMPSARVAARIALDDAVFFAGSPQSAIDPEAFREALIRIKSQAGLYESHATEVNLVGASLFSAEFSLPPKIPEGVYTVRVLLVRGGRVIDERASTIDVHKDRIGQRINSLSTERPLFYGMLAVLAALLAGWTASEVFRRIRR